MLALGDLFALRTPDSTGQSALLDALTGPGAGPGGAQQELSYFKVTHMAPSTGTSLLVDSRRTAITLEVQSSPLPARVILAVRPLLVCFAAVHAQHNNTCATQMLL